MFVLILAAGNSTRFNGIKQLANFNGLSLLQRCIDLAEQVAADKYAVVLGGNFELIKSHLKANTCYVYNKNWQKGLGNSIKAGLQIMPKNTDAVLLLLADQPLITIQQIKQLLKKFDGNHPACANYATTKDFPVTGESVIYESVIGVPAIFPASYFDQLKTLDDKSGAKKILKDNQDSLTLVPMSEAKLDIDSKQDFQKILEISNSAI
ncbi:MAG: nucleotidyltransferase family protein [Saccharospirillaceae bacterium]|nr:nucleotidyltransferase family protein [Pseudomonadales bacterium]NRB78761.1 nucleotidyltransferase family protein [Saccharospirillaceae bacterium]